MDGWNVFPILVHIFVGAFCIPVLACLPVSIPVQAQLAVGMVKKNQ